MPRDFWIQLEWICAIYLAVPLEGWGTIWPLFLKAILVNYSKYEGHFKNNTTNIICDEITNYHPIENNQQMWLIFPDVNHEELQFSKDRIFQIFPAYVLSTQLYKTGQKEGLGFFVCLFLISNLKENFQNKTNCPKANLIVFFFRKEVALCTHHEYRQRTWSLSQYHVTLGEALHPCDEVTMPAHLSWGAIKEKWLVVEGIHMHSCVAGSTGPFKTVTLGAQDMFKVTEETFSGCY